LVQIPRDFQKTVEVVTTVENRACADLWLCRARFSPGYPQVCGCCGWCLGAPPGGRSAAAQRIALDLEKAQAIPARDQPWAPAQVRECLTKR